MFGKSSPSLTTSNSITVKESPGRGNRTGDILGGGGEPTERAPCGHQWSTSLQGHLDGRKERLGPVLGLVIYSAPQRPGAVPGNQETDAISQLSGHNTTTNTLLPVL